MAAGTVGVLACVINPHTQGGSHFAVVLVQGKAALNVVGTEHHIRGMPPRQACWVRWVCRITLEQGMWYYKVRCKMLELVLTNL